jgi:methanogenesis multiheme c-type cytochrome
MKTRRVVKARLYASILALIALPLATLSAQEPDPGGVEASYHGQMGFGTGLGMLEKWCALPNFSYYQQGGIDGWSNIDKRDCITCHIGAEWNTKKPEADCGYCHKSEVPGAYDDQVTVAGCMKCHKKDVAKRGDDFVAENGNDVHIGAGFLCQDCHAKVDDGVSDHQFLKGTALDTTEPTLKGTLSCTSACHFGEEELPAHGMTPHDLSKANGETLNMHTAKVACETCHTGERPNDALARRQWNVFTEEGKPVTTMRTAGWLPEHKWYDNTGPGLSGNYHLPILGYTERRDAPDAKIYPFNAVAVDWFVKTKRSAYDDIITVPEVKAADANEDGTVTVDEMRKVYKQATLKTEDMNFSINHSVLPAEQAFECKDCHSRNGWVLDWEQLGYPGDPAKVIEDDKKPKK